MSNSQSTSIIGLGVYTLQEAAFYSSISTQKLSRWLYGTKISDPVITSQLLQEKLVSFLDLIQSKAIARARMLGVSLPRVRQAIAFANRELKIDFPLAHRYALVEFEKELHIQNGLSNTITQVTGKNKRQTLMPDVVRPFIQDLDFNKQDIVERYTPFEHNGIKITFDPWVQFGQPIVGDTGYRADILNKAYLAEGSYRSVVDEFGVDMEDVKTAVLYINSLSKSAA